MSQTLQEIPNEEEEFVAEEITELAIAIIEKVIGESAYNELRVNLWTTTIIERLLTELAKLKRPFKYIITCSLQQRTGAGLHISNATFWEPNVDGCCTIKWSNSFINCCVNVFGLQI